MSSLYLKPWFACLLLLLLYGCTQKTTVVLLSEPDGHVGNLTVGNIGGEVEMSRPAEATVISGRESSPSKPEILSEQQINAQFSVVLATLPIQPEHFLLYFEKGSTILTAESEAMLPMILQSITDRNSENISVIGHSDTAGNRDYNLRLSKERALAVSQVLIEKGTPRTHITSTSHGEENLLIKTEDNVQEEKNRRVEVVVK
ncbi:MAG: OmpA family protein [Proteobacteria bacterium]|nr:OmpA family protein [Pseudomonadota bacterium]